MNRETVPKKSSIVNASRFRIGIVVAEFNGDITEKLLQGALKTLKEHDVHESKITVTRVPGAFEIPLACLRLSKVRLSYDAIIAIGCVIRGDTDHYSVIVNESARGIMNVMLSESIPISNAILAVHTLQQAQERCGEDNNKGSEATLSALEMADTKEWG